MRNVLNINKNWAFLKDMSETPKVVPAEAEIVHLPHTWNALDGQDGGNDYFRGSCLYRKTLKKAQLPETDLYYLEFRGANSSADVYVGGKKLAHHDGGYSTWRVDITDSLERDNLVVIAVYKVYSKTRLLASSRKEITCRKARLYVFG